ncbi:MAG TPA: glycosyltransferase family 4 protein, partial [Bacilli bacterium]
KIHDLEEQLTHEAEHIISCSRSMSRDMEAIFHIPSRKISIIPNGVETAVFTPNCYPLSREDLVLPHEKIIFFIGRLVPEKGIQVLIEAMPLVIERYPDVKLVISGSGPMQDELIRQSGKLGSKVMFTGFIEDTLRNFILEQADICVFPSLYEPFGIVALEAMQSGTPIVVSDTGGLAEIIDHGVNGYKALPGHTQSLAWHIIDLLLNEHKALSMAVKAKEKAATEYNWKSIAAATHKVYDAVIRLHPNLVRE